MCKTHASTKDHYEPGLYEIRLKGHLDGKWVAWFEGLTITLEDSSSTTLGTGQADQSDVK
jgi:hypothetical protein